MVAIPVKKTTVFLPYSCTFLLVQKQNSFFEVGAFFEQTTKLPQSSPPGILPVADFAFDEAFR
jgi:hypothetical protein